MKNLIKKTKVKTKNILIFLFSLGNLPLALTQSTANPTVSSILSNGSPTLSCVGTTCDGETAIITGTNFNTNVQVLGFPTGVIKSTKVDSTTKITITFAKILANSYNTINVKNVSTNKTSSFPVYFTINIAPPTITSALSSDSNTLNCTPATCGGKQVIIKGTNFDTDATVLGFPAGVTTGCTRNSEIQMTCTLAKITTGGSYPLKIRNQSTFSSANEVYFTINVGGDPLIYNVTVDGKNSLTCNAAACENKEVIIDGANFAADAQVLGFPTNTTNPCTVRFSNQIVCPLKKLTVNSTNNIKVKNVAANLTTATGFNFPITVNILTPTITNVSVNNTNSLTCAPLDCEDKNVIITGTNFDADATVQGFASTAIKSCTKSGDNQFTCILNKLTASSTNNISVKNVIVNKTSTTLSFPITVTPLTPSITSIKSNNLDSLTCSPTTCSTKTIQITGNNFEAGAQVLGLDGLASCTRDSNTQISCNVAGLTALQGGDKSVSVKNTTSNKTSSAKIFKITVETSNPYIYSIKVNNSDTLSCSPKLCENKQVIITGSNFDPDAKILGFQEGFTKYCTRNSDSQITCFLNQLPANSGKFSHYIQVWNESSNKKSPYPTFSPFDIYVTSPTITSIKTTDDGQSSIECTPGTCRNRYITILGKNFETNVDVYPYGSFNGNSCSRISENEITCIVNKPTATLASNEVSVRNVDYTDVNLRSSNFFKFPIYVTSLDPRVTSVTEGGVNSLNCTPSTCENRSIIIQGSGFDQDAEVLGFMPNIIKSCIRNSVSQITCTTKALSASDSALSGITVRNIASNTQDPTGVTFRLNIDPKPSVTSVAVNGSSTLTCVPSECENKTVVISGTNFETGAQVLGLEGLTKSCTRNSFTQISCALNKLTSASTNNIAVSNTATNSTSISTVPFTINMATPSVTNALVSGVNSFSCNPINCENKAIIITGTNFDTDAQVLGFPTGTTKSCTRNTTNQITCIFNKLTESSTSTITVKNVASDKTSTTGFSFPITVSSLTPTLESVTVDNANSLTCKPSTCENRAIIITGTNFDTDAQVLGFGTGTTKSCTRNTLNQITCILNKLTFGSTNNISVKNIASDITTSTSVNFPITILRPSVTSVTVDGTADSLTCSPATGCAGKNIVITGENFETDAQVSGFATGVLKPNSCVVSVPSQITCELNKLTNSHSNLIQVKNVLDNVTSTGGINFSISMVKPIVLSVTVDNASSLSCLPSVCETKNVVIEGSYFAQDAEVLGFATGVLKPNSCVVTVPNKITCALNKLTSYSTNLITVRNASDNITSTSTISFPITVLAPTLASIKVDEVALGSNPLTCTTETKCKDKTFVIEGTNFDTDAQVFGFPTGVLKNNTCLRDNANKITCTLDKQTTYAGVYYIKIRNPFSSKESSSTRLNIQIPLPVPTFTDMKVDNVSQKESQSDWFLINCGPVTQCENKELVITGEGFDEDATLTMSSAFGYSVDMIKECTRNSSSQITCILKKRNINFFYYAFRVLNQQAKTSSGLRYLNLSTKPLTPTLQSVLVDNQPSLTCTAATGCENKTVIIKGSNFDDDARVSGFATGATKSCTRNNSSQITCILNKQFSARDNTISVYNVASLKGSVTIKFPIKFIVPTINSIEIEGVAVNGTNPFTCNPLSCEDKNVVIKGENFDSDAQVLGFATGVLKPNSCVVSVPSQITCKLNKLTNNSTNSVTVNNILANQTSTPAMPVPITVLGPTITSIAINGVTINGNNPFSCNLETCLDKNVVISGTNFPTDSQVLGFATGVLKPNSCVVSVPSQITCKLNKLTNNSTNSVTVKNVAWNKTSSPAYRLPINVRITPSNQLQYFNFIGNVKKAVVSQPTTFAFLKNDGTVIAEGDHSVGGSTALVQSQLTGITNIFSNGYSFAALKSTGNVVTWGSEPNGGDTSNIPTGGLTSIKTISSTQKAYAALKSNGTVVTWGDNDWGGNSSSIESELINVSAIYSTQGAFAALKKDGTVVTWGFDGSSVGNDYGADSVGVMNDLINVKAIYSTESAFAALKSNGSVVTWGSDANGGNSLSVESNLLNNVKAVYSTTGAFAALKNDGTVVTWGNSDLGGNSSIVKSQLTGVTKIFSTGSAFAAIKSNGTVVTWGNSNNGGNSSSVQSQLKGVSNIFSTGSAFAAIKSNGTVVTWGNSNNGGNSSSVQSQLVNVVRIYSNGQAFAALNNDNSIIAWGGFSDFYIPEDFEWPKY